MTNEVGFVIILMIVVIVGVNGLNLFRKQQLKRKIKREWATLPRVTNFDKEESLKKAWELSKESSKYEREVDDITWHDLDLIHVFNQINATKSSVGSELLYQRLRHLDEDDHEGDEVRRLIDYFETHDDSREKIQYVLANLGKKDYNQLWYYITNPQKGVVGNSKIYLILGILPLFLFSGLIFTGQGVLAYALIANVLLNVFLYQILKANLERELMSMNYLVNTIWLAPKLSKIDHPLQSELKDLGDKLKLVRWLGSSFRVKNGSEMELIFEYLTAVFLLPLISYNLVLTKIKQQQNETIKLIKLIGSLDMSIAILNYKQVMPYTTLPKFKQELKLTSKEMYHPLIAKPVANDVDWDRFTLVTGSNASGKSTYIKGVAINCILAQTIGVVCSKEWQMKRGQVLSSMALEDDLFEGDSYFVAEIKSVKRIVTQVESGATVYCFIDEILRGTNTVERISASASIIRWLSQFPSLGFIASHDIELTEILQAETRNIHFSESVTQEQGIMFDYRLKQGPARTRNALRLLALLDYPPQIVEEAEKRANFFDENKGW